MADLGLPAPTLSPDPRSALDLLRDTIDEGAASGEPVTVVPLAPMTNLALLARVHPEAFGRIGRVAFMGGGAHVSNATAAAEFNVFHDPEAAAIVLDACAVSDVPVTMYGLDVFYDRWSRRTGRRTPRGRLARRLVWPPTSSRSTTGGSPTTARPSVTPARWRCSSTRMP